MVVVVVACRSDESGSSAWELCRDAPRDGPTRKKHGLKTLSKRRERLKEKRKLLPDFGREMVVGAG